MAFAALTIASLTIGCSKSSDLSGVTAIYRRWETGWKDSVPCLLGPVQRSADPSLQFDLSELLDEPVQCPFWFLDDKPMPKIKWESDHDREKNENAINVWERLDGVDVPDDILANVLELNKEITFLQKCNVRQCPDFKHLVLKLVDLRLRIRAQLKLPPDEPPALDTKIVDVTPKPAPPRQTSTFGPEGGPVNADWDLAKSDGGFELRSKDGKTRQPLVMSGRPTRIGVIRDPSSPIVFVDLVPKNNYTHDTGTAIVYQLSGRRWVRVPVENAFSVTNTERRLDIIANSDGVAEWWWFKPSLTKPHRARMQRYSLDFRWACSSGDALWFAFSFDNADHDIVGRHTPLDNGEDIAARGVTKEPGLELDDTIERVRCDAGAVWTATSFHPPYDELMVCGTGSKCTTIPSPTKKKPDWELVDHHAVAVSWLDLKPNDSRRQLVRMRITGINGKTEDRVMRLPNGHRITSTEVFDDKLVGKVEGSSPGEVVLYP